MSPQALSILLDSGLETRARDACHSYQRSLGVVEQDVSSKKSAKLTQVLKGLDAEGATLKKAIDLAALDRVCQRYPYVPLACFSNIYHSVSDMCMQ